MCVCMCAVCVCFWHNHSIRTEQVYLTAAAFSFSSQPTQSYVVSSLSLCSVLFSLCLMPSPQLTLLVLSLSLGSFLYWTNSFFSPCLPLLAFPSGSEPFILYASLLISFFSHHPHFSKLHCIPAFLFTLTLPCLLFVLIPSILPFIHLSALMTVTLETWISCQDSLSAAWDTHTHRADVARGYLRSNLGRGQWYLLKERARNEGAESECDDKNIMEHRGNPERQVQIVKGN